MTRAHDMGGRFGDGPVRPELENVVFDSYWHARRARDYTGVWISGDYGILMPLDTHANAFLLKTIFDFLTTKDGWLG